MAEWNAIEKCSSRTCCAARSGRRRVDRENTLFLGCPLYFKNSLSMDRLAAGLEEKPTATLRLVDPILDQAGSRDIAEFVDHFMQFSQTRD